MYVCMYVYTTKDLQKTKQKTLELPCLSVFVHIKLVVVIISTEQCASESRSDLVITAITYNHQKDVMGKGKRDTSKPLDAGRDMQALANSASNLSNTGAPNPLGTFRATTSTTPPILFPLRLGHTYIHTYTHTYIRQSYIYCIYT